MAGRVLCIGGWPGQLMRRPARWPAPLLAWGRCRAMGLVRWRGEAQRQAWGQAVELVAWLGLMCCWECGWTLCQPNDLGTATLPANMTNRISTTVACGS